MVKQWEGFAPGSWQTSIDVHSFILENVTPYTGNDDFLTEASARTQKVWSICEALIAEEVQKGVLDVDTKNISGVNSFAPGYIDRENEVIVGLQTDAPLKRIVNPYGGMRMAKSALQQYGYDLNPETEYHFAKYRKSHNDGVFDVYPERTRLARKAALLTGLPDAYGRGRIIGDYRRVALYGTDLLIEAKKKDFEELDGPMSEERIRLREEVSEQIRALKAMKTMAQNYGCDISEPAETARQAVQAVYFAYLAGAKENNGAATSLGRVSSFFDIYMERDMKAGKLTESEAQELMDQFVIKLRLIRHLRTPEYDELFGGDPTWVTEAIGGMAVCGKTLVTKNSYRTLHTLYNLGTAPEPNLTVLWADDMPEPFKKYCAKVSIETDSIQYENDDLMRPIFGDDYAIACCVSAMKIGQEMQFFGARCNLGKALLYAINGGVDEKTGIQVVPNIEKIHTEYLDYEQVHDNYMRVLEYVAALYADTLNIIHYMHDKYAYEAVQMSLHDTNVHGVVSFGVAGLSVAADSLSAILHARVKPVYNEEGIAVDFITEGDFPKFGNDDDRVDNIAVQLVEEFSRELKKHKLYKNAQHSLSVLTITSNVVYGQKTGSTPDGRKAGEPFAPGANPMHGRDSSGALASLNSVAKIPYCDTCQDGVSNTFSISPAALGKTGEEQEHNLAAILDGYFASGAHHLNVNVFNREKLEDAMENPEKYPTLTIRVSGYAVNFHRLTKAQQQEVVNRTFHAYT